ncbi:N-acetyl sugar amidotransferase [Paracoccaceae bacterium]|nr:N-acetyl sugar amidotransferase [Paracoccaceae bacterium]
MKLCRKCIQPNTRPNITFDDEGVCGPCRYFESLKDVNWTKRRTEIEKIADRLRVSASPDGYHCIISVSGGKDSTRQALLARDELNLKPLLVCTANPWDMITHIGTENLENLTNLGFDLLTIYPCPETYKKLMKVSFDLYANHVRATELAMYTSAPRIARAYGIKMIFLGENPSLVYGEKALGEDGGDGSNILSYNTLNGGELNWINEVISDSHKLSSYKFPDLTYEGIQTEIRYLGYYFKDFNNLRNAEVAIENGLKVRNVTQEEIGAVFNFDQLDDDFNIVNQMLKYLKFGFGKATDELCELIRLGKISREDALEKVSKLDGNCSERYINSFCNYLGMSLEEFHQQCENIVNKDIFSLQGNSFKFKQDLRC